jgi:DNA polymerase-3 subunit delta'
MQIAKEIDEQLEYHQQQELLDYLQHHWWHRYHDIALVEKVESAKAALSKMAASRLVWEIMLLPNVVPA